MLGRTYNVMKKVKFKEKALQVLRKTSVVGTALSFKSLKRPLKF
jgi:hypothetical protein